MCEFESESVVYKQCIRLKFLIIVMLESYHQFVVNGCIYLK